jgi:hypothetical protein
MEKAALTFKVGEPFYCPFCGAQTIPAYLIFPKKPQHFPTF